MNTNRAYLYEVPDRPAIYKLNVILRTDEVTGNILRPQTQQTWVFFWTYQTYCKEDTCDKHYELNHLAV